MLGHSWPGPAHRVTTYSTSLRVRLDPRAALLACENRAYTRGHSARTSRVLPFRCCNLPDVDGDASRAAKSPDVDALSVSRRSLTILARPRSALPGLVPTRLTNSLQS